MLLTFLLSMVSVQASQSQMVQVFDEKGKGYHGDLYLPDQSAKKKLPLVIVIHEWWGKTEHPTTQAKRVADELGYAALAVDLYGSGKTVDNPKDAGELAGPFYKNPMMAVSLLEKFREAAPAIAQKAGVELDSKKTAAIGYCFGGSQALALGRAGKVQNIVAFHAGLASSLKAKKSPQMHALVLHGDADTFVKPDEVAAFKKEMKTAHADLKFVGYPGAVHAFTNPKATEIGKKHGIPVAYDEKADKDSWEQMKMFLKSRF